MQNVAGPQDRAFARRDHALLRHTVAIQRTPCKGLIFEAGAGRGMANIPAARRGVASHAGTREQRKYIAEIPPVKVHCFIYPKAGM